MPTRLEYALRYAALGWPTFPCEGKKPDGMLAPHGFKDATTDTARLTEWWTARPENNIGIPCGAQSGFWVLDVDPRNGGNESLDNLLQTYGRLPETLVQSTGGGGAHYLFTHDPDVLKGKLGAGLDVKRDGGYIIVEPSVTTGTYGFLDWDVFEGPAAIAAAPAWLLSLVRAKPAPADVDGAEPWNADIAKLRSALAVLESDAYDEWVTTGAALHHSSSGHVDALSLWIDWSRKSSKFEDGACEKRWASFARYGGTGRATIASIFYRAQQLGWSWRPKRKADDVSKPVAKKPNGEGAPPNGAPPAEPPDPSDGDPRPEIRIREGELPRVVDEAEGVLRMYAPDPVYQRLNKLARVVRRSVPSTRNYRRPAGVLGVQEIDVPYLTCELTRIAKWFRWDKRNDGWRRVDCPDKVAAALLAQSGRWNLPKLWSVISAPTLRPDGTVLQTPGYDELTCSVYDPGQVTFPVVAENPTIGDAEAALARIIDVIKQFPFVAEWDRSVAIAMILTGLVRRALPSAPLGAFTAPVGGSGKTLLADIVALIATGVVAPAMQYATTDEEAQKTALAVLAEGDPIVLIDNIERPLQGDWLCTALTSEIFRGRVLGQTATVNVPTTTLWLATGNQLVIKGDLTLRSLICRIDPQMERPDERSLDADELRRHIYEARPELVHAGLTIMRAFIANGCRPSDYVKPWGRFERWSGMVRAPLVWLGCADPCGSASALRDDDPVRLEHLAVMSAWIRVVGTDEITVHELLELVDPVKTVGEDTAALRAALTEVGSERSGKLSAKRLAYWLRSRVDRPIDGLRICKAGENRDHRVRWAVRRDA